MKFFLLLLALTVSGCLHEIKFVPICEGEPAKEFPCVGGCLVHLPPPSTAVRIMPNALVIKDHTGVTRCMEVAG